MLTPLQATERSKAGVRRWYGENRDDYNALRRARYAANKSVRDKARLRAANRREDERYGVVDIERQLIRIFNNKRVKVLSTGQVAQMADRSPQMLRNWERAGLIPVSIFPDIHRLYTPKQARMIATLARVITRNGGTWDNSETKLYIKDVRRRWKKA